MTAKVQGTEMMKHRGPQSLEIERRHLNAATQWTSKETYTTCHKHIQRRQGSTKRAQQLNITDIILVQGLRNLNTSKRGFNRGKYTCLYSLLYLVERQKLTQKSLSLPTFFVSKLEYEKQDCSDQNRNFINRKNQFFEGGLRQGKHLKSEIHLNVKSEIQLNAKFQNKLRRPQRHRKNACARIVQGIHQPRKMLGINQLKRIKARQIQKQRVQIEHKIKAFGCSLKPINNPKISINHIHRNRHKLQSNVIKQSIVNGNISILIKRRDNENRFKVYILEYTRKVSQKRGKQRINSQKPLYFKTQHYGNRYTLSMTFIFYYFGDIFMRKTAAPPKGKAIFNPKDYEKPGVSLEEVLQVKQAFDLFDYEGSGIIDSNQLKSSLTSFGYQSKNQTLIQAISSLSDSPDRSVAIDFPKFLDLLTANISGAHTRAGLTKVFALFDDEKTGFISIKNLRRVVKEVGETIDDAELQEMIERADLDNDGLISEEQFYAIMTRRSTKA